MRLSAGMHIVGVGGLVLDSNLTLGRLEITAASDVEMVVAEAGAGATIISSNSTLLSVRAGAPPVKLQGLELNGQIRIEGGTIEIASCRSVSARSRRRLQVGTSVRALLISGGSVMISDVTFEGLLAGAIEVSGGELSVHSSAFEKNQAEHGGALLITAGVVHVHNSTFTDNKASERGGAIRVIGLSASLELADLTEITGSTGVGGSVASDVAWTYRLPCPLAHYVSDPEQDGVAQNGAGDYDYNYPIPCSATLYGNSYNVKDQAAPSCSGSCQAGHYCGRQTISPVPCQAGTYCPQESAAELACPAGTYSPDQLAESIEACLVCGPGTFCPERSKQPTVCTPGNYNPDFGRSVCSACPSGTFQELSRSTTCKACEAGAFCGKQMEDQGAPAPTECVAGTYSNATNLSSSEQCTNCLAGFYCEKGATEPRPCPEGSVGGGTNLVAEVFCTTCPGETTSLPGTSFHCKKCNEGFYESGEDDGAVARVKCAPCLNPKAGAICSETTTLGTDALTHGSSSLATIRIQPEYWRLSARSTTLSLCLSSADGNSSCVGGDDAGDEDEFKPGYTGSGYCKAGHTGPLCQLCNTSDFYFDREEAMECTRCPKIYEKLDLPLSIVGMLLGLLLAAFVIKRFKRLWGERSRALAAEMHRLATRFQQLEIMPRCKLLFTFFQLASQITTVYNVQLSGSSRALYADSIAVLSWATFEWDGYFYPGQCIALGFHHRLLLRAILPILLLVAIPLCTITFFYCRRAHDLGTRSRWLSDALVVAAPFALFVSFLLCPTVSKGIFDTWDCTEYELDSVKGVVRTFLNADLQVVCSGNSHPEEYDGIRITAYVFLLIWPIGMPILFLLVLFPNREALRQRRKTRIVQATAFLHKEYDPAFFWWEIVTLTQRLILTGWVLLIPIEFDAWRIFLGLLTAIAYLSLVQFVRPYKRKELNTLAIAAQFSLVCVFLGGAFIKLFSGDGVDGATCDGADASDANENNVLTIVGIMVAFNFFVLVMYVTLAAYQFSASSVLPSVRLMATGQTPELELHSGLRFHLFLSHIWSSGQDQMATVKRELQLLLYGVRVFLDVDDLEEIGQLDTYVKQSQSMLFFLSKGYFFSANCKKEIAATLANGNPIMLLRETDPARGAAPMEQLLTDCPDDWREEIFVPHHPVIPWLRVKEFKLVTLKMIVSSMLLHQSKKKQSLQALDEAAPTEPNEACASRSGSPFPFASASALARLHKLKLRRVGDRNSGSRAASPACEPSASGASVFDSENQISHLGDSPRMIDGVSIPRRLSTGSSHLGDSPRMIDGVSIPRRRSTGSPNALARHRAPKPVSSQSVRSRASLNTSNEPSLHTLGADLYVSGEVTQQQLAFSTSTTLIVSADNPGAGSLAQETTYGLVPFPEPEPESEVEPELKPGALFLAPNLTGPHHAAGYSRQVPRLAL